MRGWRSGHRYDWRRDSVDIRAQHSRKPEHRIPFRGTGAGVCQADRPDNVLREGSLRDSAASAEAVLLVCVYPECIRSVSAPSLGPPLGSDLRPAAKVLGLAAHRRAWVSIRNNPNTQQFPNCRTLHLSKLEVQVGLELNTLGPNSRAGAVRHAGVAPETTASCCHSPYTAHACRQRAGAPRWLGQLQP